MSIESSVSCACTTVGVRRTAWRAGEEAEESDPRALLAGMQTRTAMLERYSYSAFSYKTEHVCSVPPRDVEAHVHLKVGAHMLLAGRLIRKLGVS